MKSSTTGGASDSARCTTSDSWRANGTTGRASAPCGSGSNEKNETAPRAPCQRRPKGQKGDGTAAQQREKAPVVNAKYAPPRVSPVCVRRVKAARGIASGEGGIRTLGTLAGTHDFQSCTFGLSVTSPRWGLRHRAPGSESPITEGHTLCDPSCRKLRLAAEREGFEPSVPFRGTPDFESGTFGHSVISPRRTLAADFPPVNGGCGARRGPNSRENA